MTFLATQAFARTRCRDCGVLIEATADHSATDGFRHGGRATRAMPRERELAHAG